jgi:predicted nucleic acid-binding protein
MGEGEAACLAVATTRGWLVASDEKRAFLREARNRLGPGRILNTPGLLVLAIRAGLITLEEADRAKHLLEQHRFRMRFNSFKDVIGT